MKALSWFAVTLSLLLWTQASSLGAQPAMPSPGPAKDEPVTEKGFRSSVFEVKHRDPGDLAAAVRPLGSGFRGSNVSFSREFRTIAVRDFPEIVTTIEAALKRLDVAEPPRADVELRLYVLVASNGPAPAGRVPEELARAIEALKSTLQYKAYSLAASFTERVRDGSRGIGGEGIAEIEEEAGPKAVHRVMQAEYHVNQLSVDPGTSPMRVHLDGFSLLLTGGGRAQLKTDVTLADGEKVVVGTSTVRDKGLVVVLSARVIR